MLTNRWNAQPLWEGRSKTSELSNSCSIAGSTCSSHVRPFGTEDFIKSARGVHHFCIFLLTPLSPVFWFSDLYLLLWFELAKSVLQVATEPHFSSSSELWINETKAMPRCLSTMTKKPKGWHLIMHRAVWTSLSPIKKDLSHIFSLCLWGLSQDTTIGSMFCELMGVSPRENFSIRSRAEMWSCSSGEFGFQMTANPIFSPGNTFISRLLLEHALFATQARVGVQQVAHDAVLLCKDDVHGNHEDTFISTQK